MENYVQRFEELLKEELEEELPDELLDLYVLLGLTIGYQVTLDDVHNAWSVWTNLTNPEHKSLIPFTELTEEIQLLDKPYADAIKRAAERFEK